MKKPNSNTKNLSLVKLIHSLISQRIVQKWLGHLNAILTKENGVAGI